MQFKKNVFKFNRRVKWEKNRKFILQHNNDADDGKKTFRLEMNEYGDLVGLVYWFGSFKKQKTFRLVNRRI